MDEYKYVKAFIWQKNDKVARLQIQDWNECDIEILLDVEVDTTILQDAFNKLAVDLELKEKECIATYKEKYSTK